MKIVTEYIKIDDEFIEKADFYHIIAPIFLTVSINQGEQKYLEDLSIFSREQRLLFAVKWYVAEVDNGGHVQFYLNPTGIVWRDALEGFRALGIEDGAKIIEESVLRMGGDPSMDRDEREQQFINSGEPDFYDLDTRLYQLERTMNIDAIMKNYVLGNRSAFYFEGEVRKYIR